MAVARGLQIGVAGCGRISQAYLAAIAQTEQVALSAVFDPREDAARAAGEAENVPFYTTLDSFVRHARLDAAIVCAPPREHREVSEALMREGIHVLCEKPFATTVDDALAMVETADDTDTLLMMASKFRYVEDLIRAKSMLASGMLGRVLFYENTFTGVVNMRGRWNADPAVSGGGVIIDNGAHSIDVVRYLFGPIRRVSAVASKAIADLPVEDTATLYVQTDSGVQGVVRLSWSVHVDTPDYITMTGTEGSLRVGWRDSVYQRSGQREWVSFGLGYDKAAAFRNQIQNFADAIRGTQDALITKEEGLCSVAVIDAAYRSLRTGGWVEVEEAACAQPLSVAK